MKQALFILIFASITAVLSYQFVIFLRKTSPYKSYVVQSGSMEPSIRVGDLIIIHAEPTYSKTDVITFKDTTQHTITHRVLEVSSDSPPRLTTKGDANQSADTEVIKVAQVIGKVVLVVPKVGYAIQFIRTPWGFIATILAPAILILSDEIKSLYRSLR